MRIKRGFRIRPTALIARQLRFEASLPTVVFGELPGGGIGAVLGDSNNVAGAVDGILESLAVYEFVTDLRVLVEIARIIDLVCLFFAFLNAFAA